MEREKEERKGRAKREECVRERERKREREIKGVNNSDRKKYVTFKWREMKEDKGVKRERKTQSKKMR